MTPDEALCCQKILSSHVQSVVATSFNERDDDLELSIVWLDGSKERVLRVWQFAESLARCNYDGTRKPDPHYQGPDLTSRTMAATLKQAMKDVDTELLKSINSESRKMGSECFRNIVLEAVEETLYYRLGPWKKQKEESNKTF